MIKVLIVMGTRPEAIKMAPVIKALKADNRFEAKVCSTSQHMEMLYQVLEFFNLQLDFDLKVMEPNQSLSSLTAKILVQLSAVVDQYKPDWILVQGDTTTAMAGALAGFYHKIKVGHIEAGLRSQNIYSPFPEEMNRSLISKLAYAHFSPTRSGVVNLKKEGIEKNVFEVGNTVVDSVLLGIELINNSDQAAYVSRFKTLDFSKKIILVTCHRRESFGEPFINICKALVEIAEALPEVSIVYPVHLNPNILLNAHKYLKHPRISLIEPLSYPDLLWLLNKSEVILTDSGGIQEEAPSLHKPVLVLRDVTERMEGVERGTAILVGTNQKKIVDQTVALLTDNTKYEKMATSVNPYGDGKSSERIVELLSTI
jgi:UDP-N-acetylglucosamine 2-epimerase (non-hydrolysing)